ncbi:DeoR/GlpR family DNA-binding transcription regulator [Collinsella sp. BM28]|uniref:DeoR/GlpR family DNA-binding transcription regulator n=1 Tax=Collinsella sp. BM28 TaxID=3378285 RepID=UPI003891BD0D
MKSERQQVILDLLQQRQTVTVKMIADTLRVSDMTVRRDLAEMAEDGLVVRVHGGAQLPRSARGSSLLRVHSHEEKKLRSVEQKRAAARAAAKIIQPGDTIFLGGGTTLELMCDYLPKADIRVVTNSMPVLNLLADNPHVELFLVGGTLRQDTRVFTTPYGSRAFYGMSTSKAFVSATGVFGNEVFGSHPDVGVLLGDACARANESYLVLDADKVGVRDFCSFTTLDHIAAAFINPEASAEAVEALEAYTTVVTE